MSEVRVRNLEPWVVEMLRDQAQRAGRSLEGYLRDRLREEALRKRLEWAAKLKARQDEFHQRYGLLSDSAELIRQDRDERG
jgi:plasmid stability protein